jgi:hypothetical protein
MTNVPLIHTTKGNLPIADLTCKVFWSVTDEYVGFTEQYFYEDELVRSSFHQMLIKPLETNSEQTTIG